MGVKGLNNNILLEVARRCNPEDVDAWQRALARWGITATRMAIMQRLKESIPLQQFLARQKAGDWAKDVELGKGFEKRLVLAGLSANLRPRQIAEQTGFLLKQVEAMIASVSIESRECFDSGDGQFRKIQPNVRVPSKKTRRR